MAKMAWYATYETEPNWYNELRIRDDVFDKNYPSVPAFTLQDMLEMMPKEILVERYKHLLMICVLHQQWVVGYDGMNSFVARKNLIYALYNRVCWLAKNRYLKGGNNEKRD
jgi:hypothetical protein